jgi:hypothetical protein
MRLNNDTTGQLPRQTLNTRTALALLALVTMAPAIAEDAYGNTREGNQGSFDPRSSGQYYYDGQDYSHLKPWLRHQRQGYDSRPYAPSPTFPRTSIYGDHARYYRVPNYGGLRTGGSWGPGTDYTVPAAPRTGIFGPDSRIHGGPDYSLLH